MTVLRSDKNQIFESRTGRVISSQDVQTDITAEAVTFDLATKVRTALNVNATYLGISGPSAAQTTAQVQALTRQVNGLIRLLSKSIAGLDDLILDNSNT